MHFNIPFLDWEYANDILEPMMNSEVIGALFNVENKTVPIPIEHHGIESFIFDTGSGHDTVRKELVRQFKDRMRYAVHGLKLSSAGGVCETEFTLAIAMKAFRDICNMNVTPHGPTSLLVARRCMHEGYAHIWATGKLPLILLPDGKTGIISVGS